MRESGAYAPVTKHGHQVVDAERTAPARDHDQKVIDTDDSITGQITFAVDAQIVERIPTLIGPVTEDVIGAIATEVRLTQGNVATDMGDRPAGQWRLIR